MDKMFSFRETDGRTVFPWFVIVFAIISPLVVYANNLGQAEVNALWRPLLFSVVLVGFIYGALFLIFRDRDKTAYLTFLLEVLIFTYGHIYNVLKPVLVFDVWIGRHRYLFPVLFSLFLIIFWRAVRFKGDYGPKKIILNIVGLTLLVFQLVRIGSYEIKSRIAAAQAKNAASSGEFLYKGSRLRDVYLIVLDAYTRSDWLKEWSGYDNSDFLASLEEMGFYVAPCSLSNYSYTIQSMTSELNMQYLHHLDIPMEDTALSARLKNSRVRGLLTDLGYEFVFFETGYPWIEMEDADRYYPADQSPTTLFDFEFLFLKTTIFAFPYDTYVTVADVSDDVTIQTHINRVRATFHYLKTPLRENKPVFVYAHIVSPHTPRIFNADGSINYRAENDPQAADQATYRFVNDQLLEAVSDILENSDPDPIIIVQADHGDGDWKHRNLILNAYYLPDNGSEKLYPSITPVNSFRIVFNEYFNGDYTLLEDRSYFSPEKQRYDFETYTDPYEHCR